LGEDDRRPDLNDDQQGEERKEDGSLISGL